MKTVSTTPARQPSGHPTGCRRLLVVTAAVLAMGPARSATAAALEPEFVPGELLVQYRATPKVVSLAERDAPTTIQTLRPRRVRLAHATREATLAELERLRSDPAVAQVQLNYIRRTFNVPNDPHYVLQWYLKQLDLEAAWDISTGGPEVVVAVIDTGIQTAHPDLSGRLLPGYDFVSDPNEAGDGDGRDPNPTDSGKSTGDGSTQHGTHVAGIIGATSNNGVGIAGVDWRCRILPVRALSASGGKGNDEDISDAIRWAAGLPVQGVPDNPNPAKVINLSFGGPGFSNVLHQAITAAIKAGAIVVAAAGNQNTDARDIYPAATPGVIAVGALDYRGQRAHYSNYGPTVDIMAPGGDLAEDTDIVKDGKPWEAGVLSTIYYTQSNSFGYHANEGTSQAAPLVAGVVALMLSVNPGLDAEGARRALWVSASSVGRCSEGCGAGMVDAAAALDYAIQAGTPKAPLLAVGCSAGGAQRGTIGASAWPLPMLLLWLGWALARLRARHRPARQRKALP